MNFSYGFGDPAGMNGDIFMVALAVYGVVFLVLSLIGIALYVMRSAALHTIARRRGLSKPWLSWIPVGSEWIIGSVSDQYRYVVRGENRSKRKVLLGLSAVNFLCGVFTAILLIIMVVRMVSAGSGMSNSMLASIAMAAVLGLGGVGAVASVVGIVLLVFRSMAIYDLYRSCDPNSAVIFLVLGIIFSFLEPIFLLVVRKKDGGMPPRRDTFITNHSQYNEPWGE